MNETTLPATEAPITRDQHLIGITTSNFQKVKLIRLDFSKDPTGVVKISGSNGEGKTSLIQSVITALTGEKPLRPLRAGTQEGEVVLETEDYTIRYSMTEKNEYLTVRAKENPKKTLGKPRELLDAMFNGFVDPLEFSDRMSNDERRAFLLKVCPVEIDLVKNAADSKEMYGDRTLKNRDVTRLEGQQKGFNGEISTVRPVLVDTTAVMAERSRREESNRNRENLLTDGKSAKQKADDSDALVARLRDELESAKEKATTAHAALQTARKAFSTAPAVETFTDLDERLSSAAKVATDIATFDRYESVSKELRTARMESQGLTEKIDDLRMSRENALRKAKFPIYGLGIDNEGNVTFNALPFEQECQSKRLRIAVALLASANPQLKWLAIKDGSSLDSKSQIALDTLCREFRLQCFLELVESSDPAAITIVDGEVGKP
jgi:AAA domain